MLIEKLLVCKAKNLRKASNNAIVIIIDNSFTLDLNCIINQLMFSLLYQQANIDVNGTEITWDKHSHSKPSRLYEHSGHGQI